MEHIRIALLTPTLHLGDPLFTKKEHLSLKKMAIDDGAKLLIYPLNSLLGSIDSLLLQGDLKAAKEEALKEIWIGPTNDLNRTNKSLRTFLDAKGFNNVKIFKSNIHYTLYCTKSA